MAYYTIKDLNKLESAPAKRIAQIQGTNRQWHPAYADIKHPRCETAGCKNPKIVRDWHWTSGKPVYRAVCSECHDKMTVAKYVVKTKVAWVNSIKAIIAHKAGFSSVTGYTNSKHPYRKHRKDYCENIDGRLGFGKCTTTVVWDGQLDVDHKDEDPSNNDSSNLQTLCKCCHAIKSNEFIKEHGQTPGRKAMGITY